ncbi:premnaspirodiene oxygenase-like [Olea europaea subsp. europaea]|nr:premnaspirodiene oxygenase-like [Olea europaea subsp. europaea]
MHQSLQSPLELRSLRSFLSLKNQVGLVWVMAKKQRNGNLTVVEGCGVVVTLGVVISAPRATKEVLKTHDVAFASRLRLPSLDTMTYNYSDIAFAPYGGSIREEVAFNLVESIQSSLFSLIDFTQKFFTYANNVVCRAAFGKRCKNQEELLPLLKEFASSSGGFDVADLFPSIKILQDISGLKSILTKLHYKIYQVFNNIIEEDLVDVLLRLKEADDLKFPITINSVKAIILHLLCIMRYPKVMAKALAELRQVLGGKDNIRKTNLEGLSYLKMPVQYHIMLIKETLRLRPPLPLLLPRVCREHKEIDGYNIPTETKSVGAHPAIYLPHKTLGTGRNLRTRTKLPPGPWKLPLIGSLHHLASAGSAPHYMLRNMARKYGPIMHLQLGETSAVVISTPKVAKEILKTHDIAFASRPKFLAPEIVTYNYLDIAFAPCGGYWRQMRKISTLELLSAKNVRSFSSIREEEASNLILSIQSSLFSPIDLTQKIISYTNNVASRAIFGNRFKNQEEVISLITDLTSTAGGFDVADLYPSIKILQVITGLKSKLMKLHYKCDRVLTDIVDEHQERLANKEKFNGRLEDEDLVDHLQQAESGDLDFPITINSIKAVLLELFSAGTDTSATAVEFAVSEMMRHPKVMENVQAELRHVLRGKDRLSATDLEGLRYMKMVIKETLRLHPPVPLLIPRVCREHREIDGYDIPIETRVILNAFAINRDPEYWEDAESFKPERFAGSEIEFIGPNFEFLPFGGGRRICPGISFGLASVEFLLAQLLYHFDWKLPDGMKPEDLDMTEILGSTTRRISKLYLVPTPRTPLG